MFGVATFYELFTFDPPGDHTCTVCTGTACYVKGADKIVGAVADAYGIAQGETTADGVVTLKTARCLGSCGLAPIVLLDGTVIGKEGPDVIVAKLHEAVAAGVPTKESATVGAHDGEDV